MSRIGSRAAKDAHPRASRRAAATGSFWLVLHALRRLSQPSSASATFTLFNSASCLRKTTPTPMPALSRPQVQDALPRFGSHREERSELRVSSRTISDKEPLCSSPPSAPRPRLSDCSQPLEHRPHCYRGARFKLAFSCGFRDLCGRLRSSVRTYAIRYDRIVVSALAGEQIASEDAYEPTRAGDPERLRQRRVQHQDDQRQKPR